MTIEVIPADSRQPGDDEKHVTQDDGQGPVRKDNKDEEVTDTAQGSSEPISVLGGPFQGGPVDDQPAGSHPHGGVGEAVRRLSRIISTSSATPSPPPDGGSAAWLCGECAIVISTLSPGTILISFSHKYWARTWSL